MASSATLKPCPQKREGGGEVRGCTHTPRQLLDALCDPGTVQVIRAGSGSPCAGDAAIEGDGVIGASGRVAGRPVACFAEDGRLASGSLGELHAATICRVLQLAAEGGVPLIGFVESAGARIQEGTPALDAYARIFRANVALAGRVPQISVITGVTAGGGCYLAALTDFVIMSEQAAMFLTGPAVVREVTGEAVTAPSLGGSSVHERTGVCQLVAPDGREAALLARRLLSYLPQHAWGPPPRADPKPPTGADPGMEIPCRCSQPYDVREVIRAVVDAGALLELAPRCARNIITGFARLEGEAVGVVANQARHLGGALDVAASQKAAHFVRICDAFGVPLVVLVDTPGFVPGTRQESAGIIRHGAELLRAFAAARVPRLTVILRQAYGGGYITMNSKDLGADFTFAWPRATIGVMGAHLAVGVVRRAEIAAAADPAAARARLAASYAEQQQGVRVVEGQGVIDAVITPGETRARLCGALAALTGKRRWTLRVGEA